MEIQDEALTAMSFNQNATCFAVGTPDGYKIFNCYPFAECYSQLDGMSIGKVEMLFSTSLVIVVGRGDQPGFSPRRVKVLNTKRHSTICELTFPTAVLTVRLNRHRLVIVLEEQIYVYDISCMKLLHTVDTYPNPRGVCGLSGGGGPGVLSYPSVNGDGVMLFDCDTLLPTKLVEAHRSEVACLSVSPDGTLLASASVKGTIIRVFDVATGDLVKQFRRGSYNATVYSIGFSQDNAFLAVSSDSGTVHVFRLQDGPAGLEDNASSVGPGNVSIASSGQQSFGDDDLGAVPKTRKESKLNVARMIRQSSQQLTKRAAESMGDFLPDSLISALQPERHFASIKIPSLHGVRSAVALGNNGKNVMVISAEGFFYNYELDQINGGDAVLLNQYSLLENRKE